MRRQSIRPHLVTRPFKSDPRRLRHEARGEMEARGSYCLTAENRSVAVIPDFRLISSDHASLNFSSTTFAASTAGATAAPLHQALVQSSLAGNQQSAHLKLGIRMLVNLIGDDLRRHPTSLQQLTSRTISTEMSCHVALTSKHTESE